GVHAEAVNQRHSIEHRNQTDAVGAEDKKEKCQDQRAPGIDPLLANIRLDNGVADEFDNSLEAVHEPGRHELVLFEIAADRPCHDQENERGYQPQHEDMLGYRKINSEYMRQRDQRMIVTAV